jgi:hypothetical protein
MPFTFSHPAAVLPFSYLSKRWLSLTGLVMGSMTPDFEYFLRMRILSKYSHTWAGLFWYDVPLGLLLVLIYNILIKDELIYHLPGFLNRRLSIYKNTGEPRHWSYVLIVIFSVLLGAFTHIVWDGFTHPMGYFVLRSHSLRHHISIANHVFQTFNILQQISSLAGAAYIIIAVATLPAREQTKAQSIILYWLILLIAAIIVVLVRIACGLSWQQYGDVIIAAISGMLIGLILTSILTPLLKVSP